VNERAEAGRLPCVGGEDEWQGFAPVVEQPGFQRQVCCESACAPAGSNRGRRSGRALGESGQPHLHSPESPLIGRSDRLYVLDVLILAGAGQMVG
jgi:hypothetical protein